MNDIVQYRRGETDAQAYRPVKTILQRSCQIKISPQGADIRDAKKLGAASPAEPMEPITRNKGEVHHGRYWMGELVASAVPLSEARMIPLASTKNPRTPVILGVTGTAVTL